MKKINQVRFRIKKLLQNFFANTHLRQRTIAIAFGEQIDSLTLNKIEEEINQRSSDVIGPVEILPSRSMGKALGAYAKETDTIYISEAFLGQATENELIAVLLEEIGHRIDARINAIEAPGDEGAIFSALVRGIKLTKAQLEQLWAEDDAIELHIGGRTILAEAADQVVDTLIDVEDADDGVTSLREALASVVDGDTITFANAGTIQLNSTLNIATGVTIDGNTDNDITTADITIDGQGSVRVFNLDDGNNNNAIDVTLNNLTITNGSAAEDGGGILSEENLTINNSTIDGNSAGRFGGGIFTGSNNTQINFVVNNSTISNNSSGDVGGGINNRRLSTATITNTTISGNSSNSTGGGLVNSSATATVTNSTITGNTSGNNNTGGLYTGGSGNNLTLTSTIVSGNITGNNNLVDIRLRSSGTFTSGGNNLIGSSGVSDNQSFNGITPAANDLTATSDGTNPTAIASILNTTLSDNGGPTLTHDLVLGSPAINGGIGTVTTDQRGLSRDTNVDIGAVEYQNQAPVNTVPATQSVAEDDGNVTFNGNLSIADIDAGTESVQAIVTVTNGTLTAANGSGATVTGDGTTTVTLTGIVSNINNALNGLVYTPNADFNGDETLTITTNDQGNTGAGGAQQDVDTVTITVTEVNDIPSFAVTGNQTIVEDAGAQTVTGFANTFDLGAADESGQTLTFTVVTDNDALFTALPTIDPNGNLTYTPATDANGVANLTITATDNGMTNGANDFQTSAEVNASITVTPVNDEPTFTLSGNQTIAEDAGMQTVNSFVTSSDAGAPNESGQTIAYTVATNNDGLFSMLPTIDSNGNLMYTPADDANGTVTLTVTGTDNGMTNGAADSKESVQTVSLTITEVNDTPSFGVTGDQRITEDAGAQTVNGFANTFDLGASDESGQTLTFTVATDNDALFSALPTIDSSGTLTYTTANDANGVANLTITATDNGTTNGADDFKTSAEVNASITVTEVNDAPSFGVTGAQTIQEDAGPQTVSGFITNPEPGPSDESGQTLTFVVTTDNDGLFSVAPAIDSSGTLTYTAADDASGVANLTITATDNGTSNGDDNFQTSPEVSGSITVTEVNDIPVITSGNSFSVAENVTTVGTLQANDPENESVTFILAGINADLFSVSSEGILSFKEAPDFETPKGGASQDSNTYTLELTAEDASQGTSTPQTVTVEVTNVNDIAPTGPSSATVQQPGDNNTIDLFANNGVVDLEGDAVTIVAVTNGQSGTVAINSDQKTLTYTPADATFSGQDNFTYTLSDGVNQPTIDLTLNYVNQTTSTGGNGISTTQVIPIANADPSLVSVIENDTAAPGSSSSTLDNLVDGVTYQASGNTDGNVAVTALTAALSQIDAAFNNLIGLYRLDSLTGAVRDANGNVVNPGEGGYTQAALGNALSNFALKVGGTTGNSGAPDGTFYESLDGQLYAPFVIANGGKYSGSITDAYSFFFGTLGGNPGNQAATAANYQTLPVAYFSFGAANPDGAAHIKSLGNNIFGFEDLPAGVGVSDYDFNDAVFSFG